MSRIERIGDAVLMLGDCQELLPTLGKVDAVVTDPPYHGVKQDAWDNQWRTDADFITWASGVSALISQCLAFNGSLYWFCSPQMASRIEVMLGGEFRILNNIVWNKAGARKGAAGTGIDVTALRCFWSANTERVIFAEPMTADQSAMSMAGYEATDLSTKANVFGSHIRAALDETGTKNKQIAALFPSKTGGLTGCVSNWLIGSNIPTQEQWATMRDFFGDALRADYEELRADYEELRADYEELRRPFNATQELEWGDVWQFPIEREQSHPTQKPISLMRHIVGISSRKAQTILDPFMGSGTTGVACAKLGRKFIGIEIEPKYFDIACERIAKAYAQPDLFITKPTPAIQDALL
jgi:adenine-specific DNA-methyltransferase